MDLTNAKTPIIVSAVIVSSILLISYLHVSNMFKKPDEKEE